MKHYTKIISSPIGSLTLVATADHVVGIFWAGENYRRYGIPEAELSPTLPILLRLEKQLDEYFEGTRTEFDVPLQFYGTDFQKKVWKRLTKIPYGETRSYVDIAKAVGSPKACRAVGGANGKNPIPIVVPCHRVIGRSGDLTGFGGGLETKKYLLDLETNHDA